ncbi:hypothetical protein K0B96_08125 [Horticoccus luteus]|uniref:Uncharacterized protein n=1 Tax=Horticoccus luteus TaxID=2862869 RepID=A0A8F9XIM5_9BACT|nr:hypothetical protein [Horticoccus luteus]QYM80560.1 hypothetical protein K0B96_08125 [Horticoccus luteus]
MDLNLQPRATTCFVSGQPFEAGNRVASFLVRATSLDVVRYDVLEAQAAGFSPEGFVACSWVQAYKPRLAGENADRALKLTSENLFFTLIDPLTEPTPENTRLVQFLALMLERKRTLKPRGLSPDGTKNVYEHAKTKQRVEVPAGELTPEFFVLVQEQLSILVGTPKLKPAAGATTPAAVGGAGAEDQTTLADIATDTNSGL